MTLRAPCRILVILSLVLFIAVRSPAEGGERRTVHVFVSLADNQNQGIVPVPARLGNGFDPADSLYWGAEAGIKTFFRRSADWMLLTCDLNPNARVMERCVFKYRTSDVYLVADAYRGNEIKQAILDFFDAAAGGTPEVIDVRFGSDKVRLAARGGASLVSYVGHDGLMDFQLPTTPRRRDDLHRDAIILACASKQYFRQPLKASGAYPLLWTTNLMAPEGYTLKAALDGWITHESGEQVHERAAVAYDKYQKCGLRGARRLFATGWE